MPLLPGDSINLRDLTAPGSATYVLNCLARAAFGPAAGAFQGGDAILGPEGIEHGGAGFALT